MRYSSLPVESLSSWAQFNDIKLDGIAISSSIKDQDGNDKGGGLIATSDHESGDILLTVPQDLILSPVRVDEHARTDRHLREVLEAVGTSFSQNPRKKTMLFLLLQLTHSSPDFQGKRIGTSTPLTDYVRYLPKEIPLPTFYSEEQTHALAGTSLSTTLTQKLASLEQEFEHLRTTTESVPWCQESWWIEEDAFLTIEDWKLADAMYRSRTLELPQVAGGSMVPGLDMANHAPEAGWNARFETDQDGNALLIVREGSRISKGQEITIMYGAGGACEMIFSYGFLDNAMHTAREILLEMEMPADDPLAMAKVRFVKQAPGVRIFHEASGSVKWESAYVWWACVNEEDGLEFDVVQTNDGERELQAMWKGDELTHASDITPLLRQDERYDVFLLRATVLVQERVELQGQRLSASQEDFESHGRSIMGQGPNLIWLLIGQLRKVELSSLVVSYQWLESEKTRLMGSDAVRNFLTPAETFRPNGSDDDFS